MSEEYIVEYSDKKEVYSFTGEAYAPIKNAKELIRCKNCKFFNGYGTCLFTDTTVQPEHFCGYAVKFEPNGEWISVERRLPSEGEEVLVTDGEDYAVGHWRPDARAWDSYSFGWLEGDTDDFVGEDIPKLNKITHWMPFKPFSKKKG